MARGNGCLRRNDPYLDNHHPHYTPLAKVDDDAIKRAGVKLAQSSDEFRKTYATPPELLQAPRVSGQSRSRPPGSTR